MTATVGELLVARVDDKPVVWQADKYIYVHEDLLAELDITDGEWSIADVRYRIVGPVALPYHGIAVTLCERV